MINKYWSSKFIKNTRNLHLGLLCPVANKTIKLIFFRSSKTRNFIAKRWRILKRKINIDECSEVLIHLSDFYTDTEHSVDTLKYFYNSFLNHKFTLKEIKKINKYYVFPIFYSNLLSVAGNWAGWERKYVIKRVKKWRKNWNPLKWLYTNIVYLFFSWQSRDYWKVIEKFYAEHSPTQV